MPKKTRQQAPEPVRTPTPTPDQDRQTSQAPNSFQPGFAPVAQDNTSVVGPVRPPPTQATATPSPAADKQWWEEHAEADKKEARKPEVDTKQMKAAATELHRAMSGWGTDEDAVLNTLRGKSPAEIAAIKSEFKKHYDADLDGWIKDELGGDDLKEAQSHMKGDKVAGVIAGLENSVGFWGDDESKIEDLMRGLDEKELERLKAHPKWQATRKKMKEALGGDDEEVFNALESGDKAKASAVRIDEAMGSSRSWYNPKSWGTDEEGVYKNLSNLSPEERKAAEKAFDERMKAKGESTTLRSELGKELSDADKARAEASLDNDTATEKAAKIEQTMEGLGTDEATLHKELESMPEAERQKVLEAYEKKFGEPLSRRLAGEVGGTDHERAKMAADGKQDDTFKLFYGMEGFGTDEQLLKDTMKGKSKEQIADMRKKWNSEYAERYGADFDSAFNGELSGRDHFDLVEIGMRGEPKTAEEKREVMEMQYDYERGSRSTWVGRNMMDFADTVGFSDSATVLDMQNERLQEAIGPDGKIAAPDSAIDDLYGYTQDDVEDYRKAKDSVTDAVATGANLTVATIATIATAGSASPWLAAALSSALGGVVGMGTKALMQGEAYGIEDIGVDALATTLGAGLSGVGESAKLMTKLDELSGAFGPKFAAMVAEQSGNPLARSMYLGTGKGMVMGTGHGLINGAMDGDALRSGFGDYVAGIGKNAGMGTLRGGLSGATSSVSSHIAGNAFTEKTLQSELAKNVTQNVMTETALTAMDASTYQGRAEDVFLRFGKSAGGGAIQGIGEGIRDHRQNGMEAAAAAAAAKETEEQVTPGKESSARDVETPKAEEPALTPEIQAALDPNRVQDPKSARDFEPAQMTPEERLKNAQAWAEQAFDSGAMNDAMAEYVIDNLDNAAKLEEVLGTHDLGMRPQGGEVLPNPDDAGWTKFHRNVRGSTPFVEGAGDGHAVHPSDVNQGGMGDCWLMAGMAASAIADPDMVQNLITENGDGTYGVKLHERGENDFYSMVENNLEIDGKLAHDFGISRSYAGDGDRVDGQTEIWGPLLEKGTAIMRGGYEEIGNGDYINKGIEVFTGEPTQDQYIGSGDGDVEVAMAQIQYALDNGMPVTVAAKNMENNPDLAKAAAKAGVVGNHAYAPTGTSSEDGTMNMINPWGTKHVDGLSAEDFGQMFSSYAISGNQTQEVYEALRGVEDRTRMERAARMKADTDS